MWQCSLLENCLVVMSPDIRKPSTKLLRRSQAGIDLFILKFNEFSAFDVQNPTNRDAYIVGNIKTKWLLISWKDIDLLMPRRLHFG